MKFKVGDQVLVTAGKDKGKKSKITKILPASNKVIVEGVNIYTKHVKPFGERAGEKVRSERPLPLSNVAIINDQGNPDRIGYSISKSGAKQRVFKKTGKVIEANQPAQTGNKKTETGSKKKEDKSKKK